MTIEHDNIPELNIEPMEDRHGSLILLEQESGGNTDRVAIHPIHLRYMAEKFGLIEASDPLAYKTIAALKRRICVLRERATYLANAIEAAPDKCHQAYARATADIADEFCNEQTSITVVSL